MASRSNAEVWVGLLNDDGVRCQNAKCNNLIKWVTGETVVYDPSYWSGITLSYDQEPGHRCARLYSSNLVDNVTGWRKITKLFLAFRAVGKDLCIE